MEYVFEYPAFKVSWFRVFIESIKSRLLKKQRKDYDENDLLID
jgi:hypothetical protein